MRQPIFLLTALSCMVISAGFFSRGNLVVGLITAGVGVFYIARVVLGARTQRQQATGREAQPVPTDAETAELRAELETVLQQSRGRMKFTRSLCILLAGIAALAFIAFDNLALALGICPFAIGAGYLFYRNAQAVQLLEANL